MIHLGTDRDPGLIPRTLDLLFETLGENLEKKREIYQYKPDKFNEIIALSDADLNMELNNKEILIKSSTYKVFAFGFLNQAWIGN